MSTAMNNLFNYGRSLPKPFDTLAGKKVAVSSKYGDGTNATLCASVIKAVNALVKMQLGKGEGAVGSVNGSTFLAEYRSSVDQDYHLVVYDSKTGNLLAAVYDDLTEVISTYTANSGNRDGAAVFLALMPSLMEDPEFGEAMAAYSDQFRDGFPDMKAATNAMALLCDNAYRRIKDETCPAHLKVSLDKSGNIMRIGQTLLDSGKFTPDAVLAGAFGIFAKTGGGTPVVKKATACIDHTDFVGKYRWGSRVFTPAEIAAIPKLPLWYVIPEEVVDICKHAQLTTGKPMQMRNFLLRGPAGTGKTMGAKAIAAGLGLPYMKYTCSAQTEVYDFIGQIFPESATVSTGDAQLDQEKAQLMEMGGITYENVAKLMKLPDLDDMDYDPAGVYLSLTGTEKADATTQECMAIVMGRVTDKVCALSRREEGAQNSGPSYTYTETDFIKALKNGYLVEIQEPTTIVQPGVLVGLNSMLEQEGSITLPTGEVIQRHPDAVVVVTTNVTYEGCRGLNQSVLDRMSLVRDVELPAPEVMAQRVMAVTGATDAHRVGQMVQVVEDMADFCRKNSITDGSVGMRSLIDWVSSTEVTGDPYQSALYTVVSKATSDEADRESIVTSVLEPIFAPSRKKAS